MLNDGTLHSSFSIIFFSEEDLPFRAATQMRNRPRLILATRLVYSLSLARSAPVIDGRLLLENGKRQL
jgi:hypothetical protein